MERELSVNGENFKYFDIGSFQQLGKLHLCITPSTNYLTLASQGQCMVRGRNRCSRLINVNVLFCSR